MKKLDNRVKLSLGIVLSVVFMILAFRRVDFNQMMNAIKGVNSLFFLIIVGIIVFNTWLRTLRWQYFLMPIKRLDMESLLSSLVIGYAANIMLPAHLGEFLRAYVIGKKRSIPIGSAFATIVTERVVDLFSLLVLMACAVAIYPFPGWVKRSGYVLFFATVALFLFLFVLKRDDERTLHWVHLILKPFPEKLRSKFLKMASSFLEGFVGLESWEHYVFVVFLSLLIWVCYGLVFLFGFLAFDYHLPWVASLVVLVFVTISVVVPSSPGYIGTYHWLCQIALGLFGISKSSALAYALVIHGINMFPFLFVGLLLAWKEGVSISRMAGSYRFKQEVAGDLK